MTKFWLAFYKNDTLVLGQITLGEHVDYSAYLRIIDDVELVMCEGVNHYTVGERTVVKGNNAIHASKEAAVAYLAGELDSAIAEYKQETEKIIDERSNLLVAMSLLHKRVLELGK